MKSSLHLKIRKNSTVTNLESGKQIITKADFTGNLVQEKLGLFYYRVGDQYFKVSKNDAEIIKPTPILRGVGHVCAVA